jgi:hypothetical protein
VSGAETDIKPKRRNGGGKQPGAGRPLGSVQAATPSQRRSIAELARQFTDDALRTLVDICRNGQSDASRVAAATAILDRGYGKPLQAHEHAGPDGQALKMPVLNVTVVTSEDG